MHSLLSFPVWERSLWPMYQSPGGEWCPGKFLSLPQQQTNSSFSLFRFLWWCAGVSLQEGWTSSESSHAWVSTHLILPDSSERGVGNFADCVGSGALYRGCLFLTSYTGERGSSWVPWSKVLVPKTLTQELLFVCGCPIHWLKGAIKENNLHAMLLMSFL